MRSKLAELVYWVVILIGISPAFLSGTVPPFSWCIGFDGGMNFFCRSGLSAIQPLLSSSMLFVYLVPLVIALALAISDKRRWRLALSLPLASMVLISLVDFKPSVAFRDTPFQNGEIIVAPSIADFNRLIMEEHLSLVTQTVRRQNVFSNLQSHNAEKLGNQAVLLSDATTVTTRRITSIDQQISTDRSEKSNLISYSEGPCLVRMNGNYCPEPGDTITHISDQARYDILTTSLVDQEALREAALSELQNQEQDASGKIAEFYAALNQAQATSAGVTFGIVWQIHLVVSLLVFSVFLVHVGILQPLFLTWAMAIVILPAQIISGTFQANFYGIFLFLFPSFTLISLAFCIRVLVLSCQQNVDIGEGIGKENLRRLVRTAFIPWMFVAIPAGCGIFLSLTWNSYAERVVYCLDVDFSEEGAKCIPEESKIVQYNENQNLEENIDNAVDLHFAVTEAELEDAIVYALANAEDAPDEIRSSVLNALFDDPTTAVFKSGLPEYDRQFEPDRCKWYRGDIGSCFRRVVKQAINGIYSTTRNNQRSNLDAWLVRELVAGRDVSQGHLERLKTELQTILAETKQTVKTLLANVFLTFRILNLFATLMFIIALIKSFLYIFARFALSEHSEKFALYEEGMQPARKPAILNAALEDGYDIPAILEHDLYVKRKYQIDNEPNDLSLPQPFGAAFRRFVNGIWFVNKVSSNSGQNRKIRKLSTEQFAVWTLRPNEVVFVQPGDIVAYSSSLKIRTEISLRLTSIVFGRMFYVSFTCAENSEGTLILRSPTKASVWTESDPDLETFNISRIVAWGKGLHFGLSGKNDLKNLYLSGAHVRVEGDAGLLLGVGSNQSQAVGAIRFLPALLLPI